ncbi:MAG: chorismate synthase [Promethearchaeota archaeon]
MASNTLGNSFKITSFGESHGKVIGIIIDGCPAGLNFDLEFIQSELDKRRPGQSHLTTSRVESDKAKLLSGVFNNMTTGAPICLLIENQDVNSAKYERFKTFLRPSQIDYTSLKRFGGFADYRGSGRFSGRITASFVMGGAIAKLILKQLKISIFAFTTSIGPIFDENIYSFTNIENSIRLREMSPVRALDKRVSQDMEKIIEQVKKEKDSVGGTIKCIALNVPEGIGTPIFNSLESSLSQAIFSIPAIKGIGFGSGFRAATLKGSQHNDPWEIVDGTIKTTKNDSGGIIGGISTGMPIEFEVAIKPTATIGKVQKTVNIETMKETEIELEGRHDPCIVPRAVVVVEAMTAIVLVDHLINQGIIPPVLKT